MDMDIDNTIEEKHGENIEISETPTGKKMVVDINQEDGKPIFVDYRDILAQANDLNYNQEMDIDDNTQQQVGIDYSDT
jgi:hypothetical protein